MSDCKCGESGGEPYHPPKLHTAKEAEVRCPEGCGAVIPIGGQYYVFAGTLFLKAEVCPDCKDAWLAYPSAMAVQGGEPHVCFGRLIETIDEAREGGYLDDHSDRNVALLLAHRARLSVDKRPAIDQPTVESDTAGQQLART